MFKQQNIKNINVLFGVFEWFCNENKGGHALDTNATPQQTQKKVQQQQKARSISKLKFLPLRPTIFHNCILIPNKSLSLNGVFFK